MKRFLPAAGQGITPDGRIIAYDDDWEFYQAETLGIGSVVRLTDTFETLTDALNRTDAVYEAFVCETACYRPGRTMPLAEDAVKVTAYWGRAECLQDDAYRASESISYAVHFRLGDEVLSGAVSLADAISELVDVFMNPTADSHKNAIAAITEAESNTLEALVLVVAGYLGEEGYWTEEEITQADIAFIRNACRVAKAMELTRTPGQITFSVAA